MFSNHKYGSLSDLKYGQNGALSNKIFLEHKTAPSIISSPYAIFLILIDTQRDRRERWLVQVKYQALDGRSVLMAQMAVFAVPSQV